MTCIRMGSLPTFMGEVFRSGRFQYLHEQVNIKTMGSSPHSKMDKIWNAEHSYPRKMEHYVHTSVESWTVVTTLRTVHICYQRKSSLCARTYSRKIRTCNRNATLQFVFNLSSNLDQLFFFPDFFCGECGYIFNHELFDEVHDGSSINHNVCL